MLSETFSSHFNPQPSPLETTQPTLDLIEEIANQDTLDYLNSQKKQEIIEKPEQTRKRSKPAQKEILSA